MTRPTYESIGDLMLEETVAEHLAKVWNGTMQKMEKFYPVDYALMQNGEVAFWVEIKCRNYSSTELAKMGGYMLSVKKLSEIRKLLDTTGIPTDLVVKLTDGIYAARLLGIGPRLKVVIAGRRDRGDPADLEPCAMLPMGHFKKVAED